MTSPYVNGSKLVSEMREIVAFERGFNDIVICEWLQTSIRNARNHCILNVVLTTLQYVNGSKLVSEVREIVVF